MNKTSFNELKHEVNINDLVRSFRRVDLNLFIVFVTIFEYGSLTVAGKHLGLTQPAVSHALARLRDALGDQLFMRKSGQFVPTSFSKTIIDDVRGALEIIRTGPLGQHVFDPTTSDANFRISMDVSMEAELLPRLMERLSREAPSVSLTSLRVKRSNIESELARGDLNLVIDLDVDYGPQIKRQVLSQDKPIVVARRGNPIFASGMTSDAFLQAQHVIVTSRKYGHALDDYKLAHQGKRRKIVMRCANLMAALKIVVKTDFALSLGREQFKAVASEPDLMVYDHPYDIGHVSNLLYWHEAVDLVPGNMWLRNVIVETFEKI